MNCTTNPTSTPDAQKASAMNAPDWTADALRIASVLAPIAASTLDDFFANKRREANTRLVASIDFGGVFEMFRDAERAGVTEALLDLAYAGIFAERGTPESGGVMKAAASETSAQLGDLADALSALAKDLRLGGLDAELLAKAEGSKDDPTAVAVADLFEQGRGAKLEELLAKVRGV